MREAAHGAVANGDEKALGRHRRVAEHGNRAGLQVNAGQVDRLDGTGYGGHIALHLGRLAQQHIHRHIDRRGRVVVGQHQLLFLGGDADHRKRAALALAKRFELRQRLGRNRHHVALLAFVAPDFLGAQAAFL